MSPEDQALFLAAIGGTTPLGTRDRIPVPPKPPSPIKLVELPATVALTDRGDVFQGAALTMILVGATMAVLIALSKVPTRASAR